MRVLVSARAVTRRGVRLHSQGGRELQWVEGRRRPISRETRTLPDGVNSSLAALTSRSVRIRTASPTRAAGRRTIGLTYCASWAHSTCRGRDLWSPRTCGTSRKPFGTIRRHRSPGSNGRTVSARLGIGPSPGESSGHDLREAGTCRPFFCTAICSCKGLPGGRRPMVKKNHH